MGTFARQEELGREAAIRPRPRSSQVGRARPWPPQADLTSHRQGRSTALADAGWSMPGGDRGRSGIRRLAPDRGMSLNQALKIEPIAVPSAVPSRSTPVKPAPIPQNGTSSPINRDISEGSRSSPAAETAFRRAAADGPTRKTTPPTNGDACAHKQGHLVPWTGTHKPINRDISSHRRGHKDAACRT